MDVGADGSAGLEQPATARARRVTIGSNRCLGDMDLNMWAKTRFGALGADHVGMNINGQLALSSPRQTASRIVVKSLVSASCWVERLSQFGGTAFS